MQQNTTWTIGKKLYLTFAILLTIKAIPFVGGLINYSVALSEGFNLIGIIFNLAGIGLAIGVFSRAKEDNLTKTGAVIGLISFIIALVAIAVFGMLSASIASTSLYYSASDSTYFTVGLLMILGLFLSFVSWVVTVVATIISYINIFKKPEADNYLYTTPQPKQTTSTTTNANSNVVGVGYNAQDIYPKEQSAPIIEKATLSSNNSVNTTQTPITSTPIVEQSEAVVTPSMTNSVNSDSEIPKITPFNTNTVTPETEVNQTTTTPINSDNGFITQITSDMLTGVNSSQAETDKAIEVEKTATTVEVKVENTSKVEENNVEKKDESITVITADMLDDE